MNSYYFKYDREGKNDGFHLKANTDAAAFRLLRYYGSGTLSKEVELGKWVDIYKRKRGNWIQIKD